MTREITHREDKHGNMIQLVSPRRLKEILDEDGDDCSRPEGWTEDDEWMVE